MELAVDCCTHLQAKLAAVLRQGMVQIHLFGGINAEVIGIDANRLVTAELGVSVGSR